MQLKNVSKTIAKDIVLEHLKNTLQKNIELVRYPEHAGGLTYAMNGRAPDFFYFFSIKPSKPEIGATRFICVSKEDGVVVFDGYEGE